MESVCLCYMLHLLHKHFFNNRIRKKIQSIVAEMFECDSDISCSVLLTHTDRQTAVTGRVCGCFITVKVTFGFLS